MNKSEFYITILDENITYNFDGTVEDAAQTIIEEYERSDVTLYDLLDYIEIKGLSVSDVVKVYSILFKEIEGDNVYRDADGMIINL